MFRDAVVQEFEHLDAESIYVGGQVRVILAETETDVLTAGEGHGIDMWTKPQTGETRP